MLFFSSNVHFFSGDAAKDYAETTIDLSLLIDVKRLKYAYNLPCAQLCTVLGHLVSVFDPEFGSKINKLGDDVSELPIGSMLVKHLITGETAPENLRKLYEPNSLELLEADPHAIYPTSIYRQCFGHVTSSADSCLIESVMGTTITTTIEIVRDVLDPSSRHLRNIYKPLGRCVAVIDQLLDMLYGDALERYFEHHGIALEKLAYRCMEVDKDISTVQRILVDLKSRRVSRNEPVLVIGGGVMADVGGFACALYHRNTPYVMLCTSIVSGIDAGPSPRTCCDGLGYKNVFGAYHPPMMTITDRSFFRTLHPGCIRHGIAEIIKMAVTKDSTLFDAVEQAGNRLIETKFGIECCDEGSDIDVLSELIIAKAMDGYVRSEYGNLWETHQCRPHAYGHTWSPGFELQAGLLHGHAVAIGMGYGAYLSYLEGWITEKDLHRILGVMSAVGLSLRHDILENTDSIWSSQLKMTEKRGGNLCAPVPRGSIGKCGYINNVTREYLEKTLLEYEEIVKQYPRGGNGIEPHCHDVGLEDPSTVKQHADNAVKMGSMATEDIDKVVNGTITQSAIDQYNEWIKSEQEKRVQQSATSSVFNSLVSMQVEADIQYPPTFQHSTLFFPGAEEYAHTMTSSDGADFVAIAEQTEKNSLFAPCMVGRIEGKFLKMVTRMSKARRVLDIGTFTGFSALSFAEGLPKNGEVISIEADRKTAAVAKECFKRAEHGHKITVLEGDAKVILGSLLEKGEMFDIVFIDADKCNYRHYYEMGLKMLNDEGILMADNALCSLVYDQNEETAIKLHEFAQYVRRDERTEQVMLTVREGILMVQKKLE